MRNAITYLAISEENNELSLHVSIIYNITVEQKYMEYTIYNI